MQELFQEYENSIENIDFRLDIERLKNDIQKRTRVYEERQMNLKGINIHNRTNLSIVMALQIRRGTTQKDKV